MWTEIHSIIQEKYLEFMWIEICFIIQKISIPMFSLCDKNQYRHKPWILKISISCELCSAFVIIIKAHKGNVVTGHGLDFLTLSYDNRTKEIYWRILYSDSTRLLLQHQTLIFYINQMYWRIYNIYILHYTHSFFLIIFHKTISGDVH